MALACRLCRVDLSALGGCAVCAPVRRNLVVIGETEDERPSLSAVNHEAIRHLRAQIDYLGGVLKTKPDSGVHCSKLVACTNALTKLTDTTRKMQDDGRKAIDGMAFSERAELFIGWFADLPPAYRQQLRETMADYEVKIAAPVPADSGLS